MSKQLTESDRAVLTQLLELKPWEENNDSRRFKFSPRKPRQTITAIGEKAGIPSRGGSSPAVGTFFGVVRRLG